MTGFERTPGRFYVLEGLSGVGKSVTLRALPALMENVRVVATVGEGYQAPRRIFDDGRDVLSRHLFYLAALAAARDEIARHLAGGHIVLAESYLARTTAFHRAMGSQLTHNLDELLPMPDITFLLTCNEEERVRRLISRDGDLTHWRRLAEANKQQILDIYADYTHHCARAVDSSGTVSATAHKIADLINEDLTCLT
jgi:thymidylate kinase